MTLNGNSDETNGYNSVIKNGALANANLVKSVIPPIGSVLAWLKSLGTTHTPSLPDGWVECNGQTLSDSDSPYNGDTIPDLNGIIQVASTATATSDTTLTDSTKTWTTNEWAGYIVEITNGAGAGQSRVIASNNGTVLTFTDTGDWATAIGSTPTYKITAGQRFLRGNTTSGGNGLGGGDWHRLTIAEMPAHTHDTNLSGGAGTSGYPSTTSSHSNLITTTATGGDDIFDNRPPFYDVVWIMRVK